MPLGSQLPYASGDPTFNRREKSMSENISTFEDWINNRVCRNCMKKLEDESEYFCSDDCESIFAEEMRREADSGETEF
jgi:hypothetical protein